MTRLFEARELEKTYGAGETAYRALRGASLCVDAGESVAIVGESGSGKSTLLSILGLLDRPTGGSLTYAGQDLLNVREREADRIRSREFGFVFQSFHLDSRATAAENVRMPLRIAGVKKDAARRVDDVLEQLGLGKRTSALASKLSGGQKQRVAIARAIACEPRVLFADEPTGALDSVTGETVIRLLFDLCKKRGMTLVMVTHSETIAARCDRMIRVSDGRVLENAKRK